MAPQSQSSPRGVQSPAIIRPPRGVDIARVALGISRAAAPILCEAQQARNIGPVLLATAKGITTSEFTEAAKDLSGVADTIKEAAHHTAPAVRALDAAGKHAKLAGQLGFDLVRIRCEVEKARIFAEELKSPAAESALVFMKPMLAQAQSAFETERFFHRRYRDVGASLKGRISGNGMVRPCSCLTGE